MTDWPLKLMQWIRIQCTGVNTGPRVIPVFVYVFYYFFVCYGFCICLSFPPKYFSACQQGVREQRCVECVEDRFCEKTRRKASLDSFHRKHERDCSNLFHSGGLGRLAIPWLQLLECLEDLRGDEGSSWYDGGILAYFGFGWAHVEGRVHPSPLN